jgi:hypothetical protein
MAVLRRQAEACDAGLGGGGGCVVVVHSMGGGTGAGLGSRLLEACREEYPKVALLSACVAPFAAGDTPLQHFNMALTLATAGEAADALVLLDNDDLLRRARARKSAAAAAAAASAAPAERGRAGGAAAAAGAGLHTSEVNDVAAEALAGLLLPTWHRGRARRRRPLAAAPAADGGSGGSGGSGGRPAWVDVREPRDAPRPRAAAAAAAGAWDGRWDAEEDDADTGDGGGGELGDAAALSPWLFDGAGLIRELVVAPRLKLLDVRAACDGAPSAAAASGFGHGPLGGGRLVATPWGELADALAGELPRYHSTVGGGGGGGGGGSGGAGGGGARAGAGAPPSPPLTLTLAARLVARGAHQTDCDAVDVDAPPPPLPLPPTGRGASAAAAAAAARARRAAPLAADASWPGLPDTADWRLAATRLRRAVHLGAGAARRPPPLSALLSPAGAGAVAVAGAAPPRSLTAVCASDVATPRLLYCVQRVDDLLRRRAYIHWYERFGVDAEDMRAAAEALLDTVDAYAEARAAL